jgi:carboxylate-amine ligase
VFAVRPNRRHASALQRGAPDGGELAVVSQSGSSGTAAPGREHARPSDTWWRWNEQAARRPWTVGVEEHVMLLEPPAWVLVPAADFVLPRIDGALGTLVAPTKYTAALKLRSTPHQSVAGAIAELGGLRRTLTAQLAPYGLRGACAGVHPFAGWQEAARHEPSFAFHVHVALPGPHGATRVLNRIRAHLPLLLALSANSPVWQGRASGLASARTPQIQAVGDSGIPPAFADYDDFVETVDGLVRDRAILDPRHVGWDVRLQPQLATIELRIMDAQTRLADCAALTALIQSLVRLESQEGFAPAALVNGPDVLAENRLLAARDGVDAELIDPVDVRRVSVRKVLADTIAACRPHAQDLDCEQELDAVLELSAQPGAQRQLRAARETVGPAGLAAGLADEF